MLLIYHPFVEDAKTISASSPSLVVTPSTGSWLKLGVILLADCRLVRLTDWVAVVAVVVVAL